MNGKRDMKSLRLLLMIEKNLFEDAWMSWKPTWNFLVLLVLRISFKTM